jgi:restriction endonuclease Mrr
MSKKGAAPSQNQLELHVLRCLETHSPQSLSGIREWIGRNVKLTPQDRLMIKMPSGKELRLYERTVGNLLTPGRSGNLTDRKLVDRPERDTYKLTEIGRRYLADQDRMLAEIEEQLKDIDFAD